MKLPRWFWITAGWFWIAVGFVGIFLPVLPTTPFLILAAFCFSKGSPKLHGWLLSHPRLGPPLQDWEKRGVIRLPIKILATFMVLTGLGIMHWRLQNLPWYLPWAGTLLIAVGMIYVWRRPSR
jgi:uncharacterized membrane protein YbaN (DUF454 family)